MNRRRGFTRLTACALAIIMGGSAILAAAGGASASPDIICCGQFFTVSVADNSTNVTISFSAAFTGYSPVTLEWKNTTASTWYSQPVSYSSSTLDGQVFLDYLQPSTTYDYILLADGGGTCTYNNVEYYCSYSSSYTTPADGSTTFSGVISLAGGGHAPAAVPVYLYCPSIGEGNGEYGFTNSLGAFSINWVTPYSTECSGEVIDVATLSEGSNWLGYWNETVVVWAPQVVNFVLPANYLTGYNISFIDFSNAPAGYTDIGVKVGTGYENSYSYSTSVSGSVGAIGAGFSSSTTSTHGVTVQEGVGSTNGNLCWATKSYVSGTVAYSGLSRAWSFTIVPYEDVAGTFCNQISGFHEPSTWMTPQNVSSNLYYLLSPNGTALEDTYLQTGNLLNYAVTVSSATSTTTDVSVSYSLSGALAGALPLSFQTQAGWSQTVSTTSSTTLSWELQPPTGGQNSCFDVFGAGGSQSQNTADMVGILWWAAPPSHDCSGGP